MAPLQSFRKIIRSYEPFPLYYVHSERLIHSWLERINNGIPVLAAPGGRGNPIPDQVLLEYRSVECCRLPPDTRARIELLFWRGSGP